MGLFPAGGVVLVAMLVVAIATVAEGQDAAPSRRSVWDRVYTDAQASRGETVYGRHCEQCHGTGLDGDAGAEIPALSSDTFMQRWNGRTVEDLFARMTRSMPQAAPGSLTPVEYGDLVAYLLKANGFPAGFEALGTDPARLRQVTIERTAR